MDNSLHSMRAIELRLQIAQAQVAKWRQFAKDARLVLGHPDLQNNVKLRNVWAMLDEQAPPPGPDEPAAAVAALLIQNRGPATALLQAIAGEEVQLVLRRYTGRELTLTECRSLHAEPGTRGYERNGTLVTETDLTVAQVRSVVITARLPAAALVRLGIPVNGAPCPSEPLGTVLADLPGFRREQFPPQIASGLDGMAVVSRGRLWAEGEPKALAYEQITPELCALAARRGVVWGKIPYVDTCLLCGSAKTADHPCPNCGR